jgi:maltose/maltodextrin transport system permease protein
MAIVRGRSRRWQKPLAHAIVLAFVIFSLFPLVMIISISLRPGNFSTGDIIPREISLEHWKTVLGIPYETPDGRIVEPPFPVLRWVWNSVKIGILSGLLILAFSTSAAYAFARLRFRFKGGILNSMLVLQMFPAVLALVAFYAIFEFLGEYVPWLGLNSHGALVLAYCGQLAVHVWTIKGYFETIPAEIEDAARVDGATPFQTFWRVLLPMAVPVMAVVFVLAFIMAVIEYPLASVVLQSQDSWTLAVGTKQFLQPQHYLWGDFAAAAVLGGLPITVVFLLAQRWLVSGLTSGGLKG